MTRAVRRGMTLLEVIVALAILAASAVVVLGVATQSWRAIGAAAEADSSLLEASAFLETVALWPREELDQRLGQRAQHPWKLGIERPLPTLYVVTLADSAGRGTLLVTSLYRAEPPRAQ